LVTVETGRAGIPGGRPKYTDARPRPLDSRADIR